VNELGRHWSVVRKTLGPWRDAMVRALQHAAHHQADAFTAVRNRPIVVQFVIGVARPGVIRDPMNYTRLTKAMVDEIRLQPAYIERAHASTSGARRARTRLRDREGRALFVNSGWALIPDDDPRWLDELPPTFQKGPTTTVHIRTREPEHG
jgi:hypothetical protein